MLFYFEMLGLGFMIGVLEIMLCGSKFIQRRISKQTTCPTKKRSGSVELDKVECLVVEADAPSSTPTNTQPKVELTPFSSSSSENHRLNMFIAINGQFPGPPVKVTNDKCQQCGC